MTDPVNRDPAVQPIPLEEGEHDLGNGTVAVWCESRSGVIVGLIERHWCAPPPADDGLDREAKHSGGYVSLNPDDGTHWTVEAGEAGTWEGLTLSPSVLCRRCGHHGWIRDGRWVDA
jgi:hypothetical protein